jgi:hypothetical protein
MVAMMGTERQTRSELVTHLHEQLEFLSTSAKLFDDGRQSEAKRLATATRLLVHDTGISRSLLGLLGVKAKLRFLNTSLPRDTEDQIRIHCGLAQIELGHDGRHATGYRAPLDDLPEIRRNRPRLLFDEWWTGTILTDNGGNSFSRKDLVLGLAHKDGGVHVDPDLEDAYAALTRGNSLGWHLYDEGGHMVLSESPVLANVRQIAFELESSLLEQLPELVGPGRQRTVARGIRGGLVIDAFELRRVEAGRQASDSRAAPQGGA